MRMRAPDYTEIFDAAAQATWVIGPVPGGMANAVLWLRYDSAHQMYEATFAREIIPALTREIDATFPLATATGFPLAIESQIRVLRLPVSPMIPTLSACLPVALHELDHLLNDTYASGSSPESDESVLTQARLIMAAPLDWSEHESRPGTLVAGTRLQAEGYWHVHQVGGPLGEWVARLVDTATNGRISALRYPAGTREAAQARAAWEESSTLMYSTGAAQPVRATPTTPFPPEPIITPVASEAATPAQTSPQMPRGHEPSAQVSPPKDSTAADPPQEFLVVWEIDLTAADPVEAAEAARDIHQDPAAPDPVFDVYDSAGGVTRVDTSDSTVETLQPAPATSVPVTTAVAQQGLSAGPGHAVSARSGSLRTGTPAATTATRSGHTPPPPGPPVRPSVPGWTP